MMTKLQNVSTHERDSNFELLRILSMGLVITSHFNLWSYPYDSLSIDMSFNVLLKLLFTVGCIANVIFILLTGYYMIKARPKYYKIIGLVIEMLFYSLLLLAFEALVIKKPISFDHLKSSLLPFPFGNWFCVMYIILYSLSPFINRALVSLDKNEFKKLILVLFVFFSLIPTIIGWHPFSNFAVFPLIYSIGAYIRLHSSDKKRKINTWLTLLIVSTAIFLSVVFIYMFAVITGKQGIISKSTHFLSTNYSPLVIICGVAIFNLFKKLKIGSNKIINYLSGSVLGVYLIHENPFVRDLIWKDIFLIDITLSPLTFISLSLCKITFVYVTCLLIDITRRLLFGRLEKILSIQIYSKISLVVNRMLKIKGSSKSSIIDNNTK